MAICSRLMGAILVLAPAHNDFINKLITGEGKKKGVCLVTCCFEIISFPPFQNKAILILYDNGLMQTYSSLFYNLVNKFLL